MVRYDIAYEPVALVRISHYTVPMKLTCLKPRLLQTAATTKTHNWVPDEQRGDRHARGYGYAWEKLRLRILAAANGLCQCPDCMGGEKRLRVADQVHHIVGKAEARQRGWTDEHIDDPSNLMAINRECHASITGKQHGWQMPPIGEHIVKIEKE